MPAPDLLTDQFHLTRLRAAHQLWAEAQERLPRVSRSDWGGLAGDFYRVREAALHAAAARADGALAIAVAEAMRAGRG